MLAPSDSCPSRCHDHQARGAALFPIPVIKPRCTLIQLNIDPTTAHDPCPGSLSLFHPPSFNEGYSGGFVQAMMTFTGFVAVLLLGATTAGASCNLPPPVRLPKAAQLCGSCLAVQCLYNSSTLLDIS